MKTRGNASEGAELVARKSSKTLLLLILMNVAASMLHYADNILFFPEYPEPTWVSPLGIDRYWFLMSPFAAWDTAYFARGGFWRLSCASIFTAS